MTKLVHLRRSFFLSLTPSPLAPHQSPRYRPRHRHTKLIALPMSGTNAKSFLGLETTANRRTLLRPDQAEQTGLHKQGLCQRSSSHNHRRGEYLLHHVYHHRQSVAYDTMIIYSIPKVDYDQLSMLQETERMHGARCLDRRALHVTCGSPHDVCQSDLACPCRLSKLR